jgi:hypothetical protein
VLVDIVLLTLPHYQQVKHSLSMSINQRPFKTVTVSLGSFFVFLLFPDLLALPSLRPSRVSQIQEVQAISEDAAIPRTPVPPSLPGRPLGPEINPRRSGRRRIFAGKRLLKKWRSTRRTVCTIILQR